MTSKRFATATAVLFLVSSSAGAAPTMTVQNVGVTPGGNREWAVIIDPDPTSSSNHSVAVEIGLTINGSTVADAGINAAVWNFANPGLAIFGWETTTPIFNNKPVGLQVRNFGGPASTATGVDESGGVPNGIVGLLGDYNSNGIVSTEDFTVWGDGLGIFFTQADYDVWAANYGNVAAAAFAPTSLNPAPDAAVFIAYGSTNVGNGDPVELLRFETSGTGATTVGWGGKFGPGGMNARLAQAAVNYDSNTGSVTSVPEPTSAGLILLALVIYAAPRRTPRQ